MKTIYMTVKGSGYYETEERRGKYVTILSYYIGDREITKRLEGDYINTTSNRMIITGIIEGLRALKESCTIKLKTHGHFGYAKIKKAIKNNTNVRSGINRDLLDILMKELIDGGHELEVTITPVYIKRENAQDH